MKRKPTKADGSSAIVKRVASRDALIRRILSKILEIDAIFLLRDDTNVLHVFSVVREFDPDLYDKLLRKERSLEKDLPEIAFEFHVRAHQGRKPAQAVPFEAEQIYAR